MILRDGDHINEECFEKITWSEVLLEWLVAVQNLK